MAVKKSKITYNEEALSITKALKVALSFNKDADVITHAGMIMAHTSVGIVFIPCSFELSCAVKAKDLYNALNKATDQFSVLEHGNQVTITWGNKRAALVTRSKVSVNAHLPDPIAAIDVPPNLAEILSDVLKDLADGASASAHKDIIYATNGVMFWTNNVIAAMIQTELGLPDALVYIKDVKAVMSYDGKLVNIGGSASSMTFHFDDGVAIKIASVDDSSVKYPKQGITALFQPQLYETSYPLHDDHLDAMAYVANFSSDLIYIQPTHIGTHISPDEGTAVSTEGLPLNIPVRADIIKLGAFKKATMLIKAPETSRTAFYTARPNVTFCFVRLARREVTPVPQQSTDMSDDLSF